MWRLALFLFLMGCVAADRTTRQAVIARYAGSSDTLAVLIISPAECFACNNAIGDLMRWEREAPNRRLLTVLTRQPTEAERAQMTIMRFRVTDVIDLGPGQPTDPQVLILRRGVVVDSAQGQKAILAIANKYNHVEK